MDAVYRDTWTEINLDYIAENIRSIKGILPQNQHLIAVVKANAYGHGDEQVARVAVEEGADMLAVAFLDEAIALREKGIQQPALVLGAVSPMHIEAASCHNIRFTMYSVEWLREAVKQCANLQTPFYVHLKVDTGMGRLGIRSKRELEEILQLLQNNPNIVLEGVFTHFATADELNSEKYNVQYESFKETVTYLAERGVCPPYIHCANSAALLRFPHETFNTVRLGIAMYGLSPSMEMKKVLPVTLKEAFSLHSRLVHVKRVHKGDTISYGATYQAEGDEWIGTVPIGYADGWIRRMQNFQVLVDGHFVPIVGRVCMDQLMVKLPKKYPIGEKVTLIGEQAGKQISIDDVAGHLQTINYEIPCMISYRVPRLFIRHGQQWGRTNYLLS
ncbi:alanine racemase [Bacillus songklensis]|uniref:Alanine racemase n=1 Tax=Bacillus songklensis TaxID=1069116 RepID=A0ABV8AWV4_9BACI